MKKKTLCFITILLLLLLNNNPLFAQTNEGTGYIMVGDVNPPWYSLLIRSTLGYVDPYKELQPVIEKHRKRMAAMGMRVVYIETPSAYDFKQAITNPNTKAIAWFGHGDENVAGLFTTLAGEDITPGDIRSWAQERLSGQIGRPEIWKGLSPQERKARREMWNNAHFDLKYVYMHTCYGLKDNSLPDVLIADDGEFWGYPEKSYLKDTSIKAVIRGGKPKPSNFDIRYDEQAIRLHPKAGDALWIKRTDTGEIANYTDNVSEPLFIQDMRYYLEVAFARYKGARFDTPDIPIVVNVVIGGSGDPGWFDHGNKQVNIRLPDKGITHSQLKHRTAHELFHAFQDVIFDKFTHIGPFSLEKIYAGAYKWWLEATADYAPSGIVWKTDFMVRQIGQGNIDPKLLEFPLTYTGKGFKPPDEDIEYDRGYFIKYLVEKAGANLKEMCETIAKASQERYITRENGLEPLDKYLRQKTGKGLHEWYRSFAGHFFFSDTRPLKTVLSPDKSVSGGRMRFTLDENKSSENNLLFITTTDLKPEYTTILNAVDVDIKADSEAKLTISSVFQSNQVIVDVYLLESIDDPSDPTENYSFSQTPTPVVTISNSNEQKDFGVKKGEVIFLVITNSSLDANGEARLVLKRADEGLKRYNLELVGPEKAFVGDEVELDLKINSIDSKGNLSPLSTEELKRFRFRWSIDNRERSDLKVKVRIQNEGENRFNVHGLKVLGILPKESKVEVGNAELIVKGIKKEEEAKCKFSGAAPDIWEGGSHEKGFNIKRQQAKSKGTGFCKWEASVGAEIWGKCDPSFAPGKYEEIVPKLQEEEKYHKSWGKTSEIRPFSIGDFKGYFLNTSVNFYRGSWSDEGFKGDSVSANGHGYIIKGQKVIELGYSVGGGGCWDNTDRAFLEAHAHTAQSEAKAILAGLQIKAGTITKTPYTGPKLDGSDMPKVVLVPSQLEKLKVGDVVKVEVVVENAKPEDSPFKYNWSGEFEGKPETSRDNNTVRIKPAKPGKYTLSVSVDGARFGLGSASLNYEVADFKVKIERVPPEKRPLPVGSKARFKATLTSDGKPTTGEFVYRWKSHPEVAFSKLDSTSNEIDATFSRTGKTKVWVQVLEKRGEILSTVAESEPIEIDVIKFEDTEEGKKAKEIAEKLNKAKELAGQGKLDEAITLTEEASKIDKNAVAPVLIELSAISKKQGWDSVYNRDFGTGVKRLEDAVRLNPGDQDAKNKLSQAKRFAGIWPQVEQKIKEFDDFIAQKKVWSAYKKMLEIQEMQKEMPGTMANPPSKKITDDLNKALKEYNDFSQEASRKHTEYFKSQDWDAMLKNAQDMMKRELSPADDKEAKSRIQFAQQMLGDQRKIMDFYEMAKADYERKAISEPYKVAKELREKTYAFTEKDPRKKQLLDLAAAIENQEKIKSAMEYAKTYFRLGEEALRGYNYEGAAKHFAEGLKAIRDNGDIKDPDYAKYYKLYEEANAKDKRIKELSPGVQSAAMTDQPLPVETIDKAIKDVNEILTLQPNNQDAQIYKNRLEAKIKNVKDNKLKGEALWNEGKGLFDQNRHSDALTKFKESLKYLPTSEHTKYVQELETKLNQNKEMAKKLRAEGEALQNQNRLEEAVAKYRESLQYLPDSKLEEHIKLIEAKIAETKNKKQTADKLWQEGRALYDQNKWSDALTKFKESLTYWSDPVHQDYVQKMEAAKAAAKQFRDEGETLQNQGRLLEAVNKYKESVKIWPDPALEEHIVKVQNEIKKQQNTEAKKACAKKNRDEGAALQQQGLLKEALAKYKDSYDCWPTPDMEQHIKTVEAKITQITQVPASPFYHVDLTPYGGKKGSPRKVKDIEVEDSSWIRLKATDEKRLSLNIVLPSPMSANSVAIVSNLDNAHYVKHGVVTTTLTVETTSGDRVFEFKAGVHSSEWNRGETGGADHNFPKETHIGNKRWLAVFPLASGSVVTGLRFDHRDTDPKFYHAGHALGFCLRGITLITSGYQVTHTSSDTIVSPPQKGALIFNNGNIGGVGNGPTRSTTFTINRPHHITLVQNYHWNNARGSTPGTIELRNQHGQTFGPWQAKGSPGQGGVSNAYWNVYPNISIPAGTYTVIDSNPSSWAQNSGSQGAGFSRVEGYPQDVTQIDSGTKPPPDSTIKPTQNTITITLKNVSSENVHIFQKGDAFSPANRLIPGESRKVTITAPSTGWLEFCAGRNGQIISCERKGIDPGDTSRTYTVIFDESNPYKKLIIQTGLR